MAAIIELKPFFFANQHGRGVGLRVQVDDENLLPVPPARIVPRPTTVVVFATPPLRLITAMIFAGIRLPTSSFFLSLQILSHFIFLFKAPSNFEVARLYAPSGPASPALSI
jgi:hypothetical protein